MDAPQQTTNRSNPVVVLLAATAVGILLLLGALLFLLTRPPDLGAGPNETQLRADLIGQDLSWSGKGNGAAADRVTLTRDKLRSVQIVDRLRDTKAGTE